MRREASRVALLSLISCRQKAGASQARARREVNPLRLHPRERASSPRVRSPLVSSPRASSPRERSLRDFLGHGGGCYEFITLCESRTARGFS
jgi:hypothetical protein